MEVLDSLGLTLSLKLKFEGLLKKANFLSQIVSDLPSAFSIRADLGSGGPIKNEEDISRKTCTAGSIVDFRMEDKAESKYPEVAAASIIAKYMRDVIMENVSKVGYLNREEDSEQLLNYRHGVRLTFENVRRILKKYYLSKWMNFLGR